MKKLFVMILLLAFSMPSFAQEVKLICKLVDSDGTRDTRNISFDEERGTVDGVNINASCSSGCNRYFISDTEFGWTNVRNNGDESFRITVGRSDGEYRFIGSSGRLVSSGTCVPFKKAF
jgi:hypothetical protein